MTAWLLGVEFADLYPRAARAMLISWALVLLGFVTLFWFPMVGVAIMTVGAVMTGACFLYAQWKLILQPFAITYPKHAQGLFVSILVMLAGILLWWQLSQVFRYLFALGFLGTAFFHTIAFTSIYLRSRR